MGTMKSRMRTSVRNREKPSNSEKATVNRAGGVAFEIEDPAIKLITMTAGAFFAEPRYYNGVPLAGPSGSNGKSGVSARFGKLKQRLDTYRDNLKVLSKDELDSVTCEILQAAMDIANGDNPEDLLIIARWLRDEMNIRSTPQALLVVASRLKPTQKYVRAYAPHIVLRPDEVKTCILMHRYFFGFKSLKNCLANGLADRLGQFNERGLLKYDGSDWPTWKDVLLMLPRKKGKPVSREIAEYFINGKVLDAAATPVIASRKALAQKAKFDGEAKELAQASFVNWEVLLSQFGDQKKDIWEFLIDQDLVGYMALLRNLRNMLDCGASTETIKAVAAKLEDRESVLRSRQFPFRFLSAVNIVRNHSADTRKVNRLVTAVERASTIAAENVPTIPGLTVIFADNSGSMGVTVSQKSQVTCADAANTLCAIAGLRAEDSYVNAFGTDVGEVRFSKTDTVLAIADKVRRANTKGMATNGYRCIEFCEELARNGVVPDRIIILSDMQCWNSNGWNSNKSMADEWAKYRLMKGTDKTWLHSVHLNGYGDNPIQETEPKVNLISGFSEKLFGMLLQAEGVTEDGGATEAVPTLVQVREGFRIQLDEKLTKDTQEGFLPDTYADDANEYEVQD